MVHKSFLVLGGLTLTLFTISALSACGEFEPRDKRFYYRALWNFALRENLKELNMNLMGRCWALQSVRKSPPDWRERCSSDRGQGSEGNASVHPFTPGSESQ